MKQRSQIRRVSLKRAKELNGKNFSFNSTIRRKTCDAKHVAPNFQGHPVNGTVLNSAYQYQRITCKPAWGDSRKSSGKQRKPIKKQSERQRKRLASLAAVRLKWWKQSQDTGIPLICGICDEPIRWFEDLASDHIEPGSAKSDDESNLQPAHAATCNMIKGSQRNFKIVRGDKNWKLIHGEL